MADGSERGVIQLALSCQNANLGRIITSPEKLSGKAFYCTLSNFMN
jgi:hypothetical protein